MGRGFFVVLGLSGLLCLPAAVVRAEESADLPAMPAATAEGPAEAAPKPVRLSMEFQNATLKDVLRVFSQQSGINVIASSDVGEKPITLYLEDVSVMDALDQILRAGDLVYERAPESEIYIVRAKPPEAPPGAIAPALITRVYKVRFARLSTSILAKAAGAFSVKTPFEAASSAEGGSSGGLGGGGGGSSGKDLVGIDTVIKELLTDQGEVLVDPRTNSLIVTDAPESFSRVEAALVTLDVRTPQILIDVELLETTLGKTKDLGIEWGMGSEGDLFSIVPASKTTRSPFSLFSEGGALKPLSDTLELTPGTMRFGSAGNATSALGVLQALESDSDTKILARPRVLTLDNETAVIRLTADEAIGFTSSNQQSTGTTTSEPERAKTGVILVVTPQINEENFITMLVEPSVTKTVASRIEPPSDQSTPRDPKTRSSRTLVRIRSGDTLVVGGLIDRTDEQSLRRVPVLSGIPIFGEAFKNQETSNSASELIVFVTPTIVQEAEAAQVASAAVGAMSLREQESAGGAREEQIEHALNAHEQP